MCNGVETIGLGGRGKYVQLIGVQQAFHRAYTLQLSNNWVIYTILQCLSYL